jgi:hypothetical protein
MPWSKEERDALVREDMALSLERDELAKIPYREWGERDTIVTNRLSDLYKEYRAGLPVLALSRCPVCQEVFRNRFDPYGLDGLWWGKRSAAGFVSDGCPHYFALSGAVRLGAPLERTSGKVEPGPEAPFVVRRLIEHPALRAVIYSLPVGPHTAFPIFYFADPFPWDIERINTWTKDDYCFTEGGRWWWRSYLDSLRDYDFDLAPWIERGKVFYIRPGDESMQLRNTVEGCPYLNLPGHRVPVRIDRGQVIWPKPGRSESKPGP